MATYQEQIAQWRAQRAQQQINDRLEQIRSEYREVQRERDQAIADNDLETAELRDQDCQQLEQEWHHYDPPQPQVPPVWQNWIRRNPNSNDPRYTGMGMTPQQIFTKQGLDKLDDLLETHGSQLWGARFDKNEQ